MLAQVTEMRFSLALFLHQMEQSLQEGFGQMWAEVVAREEQVVAATGARSSATGAGGSAQVKAAVAHLTKQLKQNENSYRAELEKNKVK